MLKFESTQQYFKTHPTDYPTSSAETTTDPCFWAVIIIIEVSIITKIKMHGVKKTHQFIVSNQ